MKNAYLEITNYSKNDMDVHLMKMNIYEIFEPIYQAYTDKKLCAKIVKYIVYSYTFGSPKLLFGTDRKKEKEKIFNELGLPEKYHDGIVVMGHESPIVDSVIKWMRFDDNAQFEYLITIKDAYVQYQAAVLKGEGIDLTQKIKYIDCMDDLKTKISKAEGDLKIQDPLYAEVFKEVIKARATGGNVAGLETFLKD